MAMAPRRGLREDPRRDALSLTGGGSREGLEALATRRRDRTAALRFLKRAMKRYGRPRSIVTDRLRSYAAALRVIGIGERQECGRWLNNRAESSHQPLRRRERAMAKFRDGKTLQEFASVHASIHNHFNRDRRLNRRDIFKQKPRSRPGRVVPACGLRSPTYCFLETGSIWSDSARRKPRSHDAGRTLAFQPPPPPGPPRRAMKPFEGL